MKAKTKTNGTEEKKTTAKKTAKAKAKAKKKVKNKANKIEVGHKVNTDKSGGLCVAAYWAKLFQQNEKNWKAKKHDDILLDEAITAEMNRAFPGRDSAVFQHVALVRGRYRRGALHGGGTHKGESFRYLREEDGTIVRATPRGKKLEKPAKAKKETAKKKAAPKAKKKAGASASK